MDGHDDRRRFSRSERITLARGRGDEFRPAREAQEIVDGLRNVLAATVVLYDGQKQALNVAGRKGWLSLRAASNNEAFLCYVEARVCDRWTLYVCSRKRLHPDAEALARWAAGKLAPYLPRRGAEEPTSPPFGGGGGSGGSAEIGIPVWWARKVRN